MKCRSAAAASAGNQAARSPPGWGTPDLPVSQCQNQEEVGSENRDGQQRQQFRLAIPVKEQAGEDQQLKLKRAQGRQVIGRKYDRDENTELPGSESHAAPTVVGEALAFRLGRE